MTWFSKLRRYVPGGGQPPSDRSDASSNVTADELVEAGNAREDAGDAAGAVGCYREAVAIAPGHPKTHLNLGNGLAMLGRVQEAEAAYREVIRLQPRTATGRFNLAKLLSSTGDKKAAECLLREALEIDPNLVAAQVALATILAEDQRNQEAESILRQALAAHPGHPGAMFQLGQVLVSHGRYEEAIDLVATARENVADADSAVLFALNNRTGIDPHRVFDLHVRSGTVIARRAGDPYTSWANSPDPEKRLRVGYVSGDFRVHPVGMLMKPVLEQQGDPLLEVHCYSNSTTSDPVTDTLKRSVPRWHDVAGLSDHAFAEMVRAHGIDVLVDLSGHTNANRLEVFARHPAPVQATWLGYLNTSGLPTMDYRVCDRYTDPLGETEAFYTEQLARLPHSQWCYEPWWAPDDFIRNAPARGAVQFGSVNSANKLSDLALDLWARILHVETTGELTILDVAPEKRESLTARFASRGIAPGRLKMMGRLPIGDYYRAIGALDIALDAFPYNGGTTTLDTLWMGTPVVALKGDRPISRSSFSIMSTLGVRELIALTPEEYVDKNLRLARDPGLRQEFHRTLSGRLRASALMDAKTFASNLEHCYRQMWRSWCHAANHPLSHQTGARIQSARHRP